MKKDNKKSFGITRTALLLGCVLLLTMSAEAQKGLFVKFSLGPGIAIENSGINSSIAVIIIIVEYVRFPESYTWKSRFTIIEIVVMKSYSYC